jgi:hypothetical protein
VPVVLGLWLITVVGQASVGSVAEVKVVGGRVHIKATAVSVSEVQDSLSRTTGMKVVYDGAAPSDRLTATIDAGSETEALSRLLEGLGLTYAFKLDSGGRHVETLFITSSSTRRASSGTTAMAASPRADQAASEDENDALAPDEPDPANDPAAVGQQPAMGQPAMAQPSPDGVGMAQGSPGYAGGQVGAAPVVDEPSPAFPSGASLPTPSNPFPGNPGFPGIPAFPGPASYP